VTGFFFGPPLDDPPDDDDRPGDDPRDGPTFADVVNGLTLGGRRRRGVQPSTTDGPAGPEEGAGGQPMDFPTERISARDIARWDRSRPRPQTPLDAVEADLADAAGAAIVRPYAWTRGRTKSTRDLRIEALVTTSELGEDIEALTQTEHRSVAELCAEPRSVAEVATLLHVPLGVAKVLLGDMADLGLVIVHKTATGGANKAHLMLMERVLSGLRRL
jgi:uncharacterized protein DUF742